MTRDDEPGILEVMNTSILKRRGISLNSVIMIAVLLGVAFVIVLLFAGQDAGGIKPLKPSSVANSTIPPAQPIQPSAPVASAIPEEDKPEANAHFEPASLRLGYVRPESVITSEFRLFNDSQYPLVVK